MTTTEKVRCWACNNPYDGWATRGRDPRDPSRRCHQCAGSGYTERPVLVPANENGLLCCPRCGDGREAGKELCTECERTAAASRTHTPHQRNVRYAGMRRRP